MDGGYKGNPENKALIHVQVLAMSNMCTIKL